MLAAADRASAGTRKAWVAEAQKICKEWAAKYQPALTSDAVPIRPERICAELTRHVPDDAIVVVDTGHAGMWMGGMLRSHAVRAELYAQRRPSRLGISGRARREMRVPRPPGGDVHRRRRASGTTSPRSRPRCAGSINAVTVVNNNGGGNQSKRGFDRVYGGTQTEQARELWTFSKMNFARIAEDMGALGIRVEKPGGPRPRARAGA